MTNPPNYNPVYPFSVDDGSGGPTLAPWYVRGWTAQDQIELPASIFDETGTGPGFPPDAVFVMLAQNYFDVDSNFLGGYLTFWPSDNITVTEGSSVWRMPQRLAGTLTWPGVDVGTSPWAFSMEGSGKIFIWAGQLVVRLLATDSPNLVTDSGDPLMYHVVEHFAGGMEFDISVPSDTANYTSIYSLMVDGSRKPFKFDPLFPMGNPLPPQPGL